jgi:hypothetical protein
MGKRKYRKLRRRIEALEAQIVGYEPSTIPSAIIDPLHLWRGTAGDYAGYIDDEEGEMWHPCGYV